jgi:hypothetical protein
MLLISHSWGTKAPGHWLQMCRDASTAKHMPPSPPPAPPSHLQAHQPVVHELAQHHLCVEEGEHGHGGHGVQHHQRLDEPRHLRGLALQAGALVLRHHDGHVHGDDVLGDLGVWWGVGVGVLGRCCGGM